MINFPLFNSVRGTSENNKVRDSGSVKATTESAKVAAAKPVTIIERKPHLERRKKHPPEDDQAADPVKHIDIEV